MAYIDNDTGSIRFEAIRFVDSEGNQQHFDAAEFSQCTNSNASGDLSEHSSVEELIVSATNCATEQKEHFNSWR